MFLKIRCSAIGLVMTDAQGARLTDKQVAKIDELKERSKIKPLTVAQIETLNNLIKKRDEPVLSDTAKNYIEERYIALKYGRHNDFVNRFVVKGLQVEEDSLTLFSKFTKTFHAKNETHFSNHWITGTPDIITSDHVIDIKSSWDIFTFTRAKRKLNPMYYWQLMGYLWLTGLEKATIAYCLINTPEQLIDDEKRRLKYKMGVIDDENELYIDACKQLEKEMKFDDIPISNRVHTWEIIRSESAIRKIEQRVELCRGYFNTLIDEQNKTKQ